MLYIEFLPDEFLTTRVVARGLAVSTHRKINMASCPLITAVICVLITAVATIVAFATPNWLKFRGENQDNLCAAGILYGDFCPNCECGLWLRCGNQNSGINLDNCKWFFADDFRIEQSQPGKCINCSERMGRCKQLNLYILYFCTCLPTVAVISAHLTT